jgi:hypothetical protein
MVAAGVVQMMLDAIGVPAGTDRVTLEGQLQNWMVEFAKAHSKMLVEQLEKIREMVNANDAHDDWVELRALLSAIAGEVDAAIGAEEKHGSIDSEG